MCYNQNELNATVDKCGDTHLTTTYYNYDAMGRISSMGVGENTASYTYDTYGQLTKEETIDKTIEYWYNDSTGNLERVTTNGNSITLGYTNDRLTSYNNKAITYNANGGVATYDGWNYNWNNQGKLASITTKSNARAIKPVLSPSKTYSFTYNALGQRIASNYSYFRSDDGITAIPIGEVTSYSKTFYYDNAGRLLTESINETAYGVGDTSRAINFIYDESSLIGFEYFNGTDESVYYYQRNLLGDVIAIYDTTGTKVVEYSYDAWGNCTIKGTTTNYVIAHANPIRYRGYYYDEDTKLYYLNTRYYSPEFRRFISPDDIAYLNPENINGLNLYCYCNNDPVNYKQRPVFSGGSITNSALSGTLGGGFMPIINPSSGGSGIFNSVLANGSFRNGLFFGKETVTGLYASGHARAQISLKNGKFVLGAFDKFSLLNATGQIGIGNDDFSVSLVGVGDIGTVSAMAGILIDPSKNTYFAGIEAKAAVFTVRGGVQFEIFDTQIEVGGSVSALSAGFQFGVGIKDGEFYYTSGFAVLFGYDFYIRIRFA